MMPNSEELLHLYKHFKNGRKQHEDNWRLLDAYDRGEFWKTLKAKLPPHQILPETNYVNYIKTNYINSIYSGTYRGNIFPRKPEDEQLVRHLNAFIEYLWDKIGMPQSQLKAGDRSALLNIGCIEFGWDNDILDGIDENHQSKGLLASKFIDTMSLYLDPSVVDPYRGKAVFIADELTIKELKAISRFREKLDGWLEKNKNQFIMEPQNGYVNTYQKSAEDKVVRLLTIYYRNEDNSLAQIWMLDDGTILDEKPKLLINEFPISLLYGNPPVVDAYGPSTCKLVLGNILTINMMDSIEATYTYSSIRRTKIISSSSGINTSSFAQYGNDPDKVFVINGDPNNAVRYVDLPQLYNNLPQLRERLEQSIFLVTGVDFRYTGRDTGSITTTGGMEQLQQRISMTDNTRIFLLEEFVKRCTKLILDFYCNYADKVYLPTKDKNGNIFDVTEIDFKEVRKKRFDFTIHATPHLPKNKLRLAEAANIIMEKQAQYQMDPQLMTPEEWLACQDLPNANLILDRMEQDRQRNDQEEIMANIANFSGLVQNGARPESAIDIMTGEKALQRNNPKLGNTGNANSFQARQMG